MSVSFLVFTYQCVEVSTNSRALTTTSVPSASVPDKYYLNEFSFLANIFHRDSVGREWCYTSAAEQCFVCVVLSRVLFESVVTNSTKTPSLLRDNVLKLKLGKNYCQVAHLTSSLFPHS